MYVEVGEEGDTINSFAYTYAFQVHTTKYVEDKFFKQGLPLAARSLIIVPELTDVWMKSFLDSNVENLAQWGEQI